MALSGNTTEQKVWNFFRSKGLTEQGTAGLMGNLYAESGINPKNLQNTYERSLGYSDDSYTIAVDRGTYKNFVNDSGGYGLAQWTYHSRKRALLTYARSLNKSIGDLEMQLNFLHDELKNNYSSVISVLKSTTDVKTASDAVLLDFERPADQSVTARNRRANYGKEYYAKYSGSAISGGAGDITRTKGYLLVQEARKHLGKPYVFGADGPNSFDCSGYIKWIYNTALDYGMTARTAYSQQNLGKPVSNTAPLAGDLVFFKDIYDSGRSPNISHVGMFTGEGTEFIQAIGSNVNIADVQDNYWKSHYYSTKRLLSESDTYGGLSGLIDGALGYVSNSAYDTVTGLAGGLPLTRVNYYAEELESALEDLNTSGEKYCSLVDLTYGGEFKFYMPESFSESLPVSWDINNSIIGRSVPIVGYSSTGPRSIPIEVELFAGEGYYSLKGKSHEEVMKIMYDDINFIKSLEYPNYDYTIVQPPSVVLLSLGANVKIKGVLSNLTINYHKPVDSKNRAMRVIISFTVTQVSDEPPGRSDILNITNRSY